VNLLDIVSSAEGSVLVKFGETVVVATIKTEVSEPELSLPEEGVLGKFHKSIQGSND
jgi:exosome complex RNA-binding protein Rrp42 (RNase PH superfamily)